MPGLIKSCKTKQGLFSKKALYLQIICFKAAEVIVWGYNNNFSELALTRARANWYMLEMCG